MSYPTSFSGYEKKIFLKKSINSEFEMNEKELFKNYDVIKKILKNKKVKITYQNDKKILS